MSAASQATGAETDLDGAAEPKPKAKTRGKGKGKAKSSPSERLEVQLEHSRWRHFGWMMFGTLSGALLIWKLGTVGKMLGFVLVVIAGFAAYNFFRTLLNAAGSIQITADNITLPLGLCRGKEHNDELDNVKHAYFLRRAVPWTRAGPVLVIETGERSFTYPRDWFASESDQRRIARRVNDHLGRDA